MFNDSGEKLKSFAKILFVLNVISSIILAILFGNSRNYSFDILVFLPVLLGGLLYAYVVSLALHALGELIETSNLIRASSREMDHQLHKAVDTIENDLKEIKVRLERIQVSASNETGAAEGTQAQNLNGIKHIQQLDDELRARPE